MSLFVHAIILIYFPGFSFIFVNLSDLFQWRIEPDGFEKKEFQALLKYRSSASIVSFLLPNTVFVESISIWCRIHGYLWFIIGICAVCSGLYSDSMIK